MIKLLLVDDQEMFRQGLTSLLSLEADLLVVGEANNGREAIYLTESLQPDIILMDVRMPICNGVEATRIIHQRFPWIKILVLTTFDYDEYVWQSLEAGALSYLLKSTSAYQSFKFSLTPYLNNKSCFSSKMRSRTGRYLFN